jgi:uncharacterized protein YecT (DUF1311 family)
MKHLILIFLISCNFCFSQTQLEMNEEADENYKKTDKELNVVYNKILAENKSDTKFISKLKAAQKAWILFRDAEMEAMFPEEDKRLHYGSVFPMCWSMRLTELTKERIKKLKIWANGIEEGDVCSGSIKIKQ